MDKSRRNFIFLLFVLLIHTLYGNNIALTLVPGSNRLGFACSSEELKKLMPEVQECSEELFHLINVARLSYEQISKSPEVANPRDLMKELDQRTTSLTATLIDNRQLINSEIVRDIFPNSASRAFQMHSDFARYLFYEFINPESSSEFNWTKQTGEDGLTSLTSTVSLLECNLRLEPYFGSGLWDPHQEIVDGFQNDDGNPNTTLQNLAFLYDHLYTLLFKAYVMDMTINQFLYTDLKNKPNSQELLSCY